MKKFGVIILLLVGFVFPAYSRENPDLREISPVKDGDSPSVENARSFDTSNGDTESASVSGKSEKQIWMGTDISFATALDWQNYGFGLNPLLLYDDTFSFRIHARPYLAVAPSETYRSELSLIIDFYVRFASLLHEKISFDKNDKFPHSEISPGRQFQFTLGVLPVYRIGAGWDNIFRLTPDSYLEIGLEYLLSVDLIFPAHRFGLKTAVGGDAPEGFRWFLKEELYTGVTFGLIQASWGEIFSRTTLYGEYDMLRLTEKPTTDYTLRLFSDFFFGYTDAIRSTEAYKSYGYRFSDIYATETIGLKSDVTERAELLLAGSYWFRKSPYYSEESVFGFKTGAAVYFDGSQPTGWYRSRIEGKETPPNRYALRAYYWGGYNITAREWNSVLQVLFDIRLGGEPRNLGYSRSVGSEPSFPPLPLQ